MQGENQNTEKSRITERVRSWEKYGGWTNLKPKGKHPKNAPLGRGLYGGKFWAAVKIKNKCPYTRL